MKKRQISDIIKLMQENAQGKGIDMDKALEEILKRAKPYDDTTREDFENALTPEVKDKLEELFQKKENKKWIKKAKYKAYFCVFDKRRLHGRKVSPNEVPSVYLRMFEGKPTISISYTA